MIRGCVLALALVVLPGCAPTAPLTPAPPTTAAPTRSAAQAQPTAAGLAKVRLGALVASVSNAGIYLAEDNGYFAEQGISLDYIPFRSGDEQAAFLATGDLDVGTGGPNAGVYNAAARNIKTKIVADKGHSAPGFDWQRLVANKDLYTQGTLRSAADVRGRKVAIVGKGATQEVLMHNLTDKLGMKLDDVDLQVMPFPDMVAALSNRGVELAMASEPQLTTMIEQGIGVPIASSNEFYPDQQVSVIFYSEKFTTDRPDLAKRWMLAYLKGIREYDEAIANGTNKERVVKSFLDHKSIPTPEFFDKMNKVALDPYGRVNTSSIQYDLEYYLSTNQVSQRVSLEQITDNSFVDGALATLGSYGP